MTGQPVAAANTYAKSVFPNGSIDSQAQSTASEPCCDSEAPTLITMIDPSASLRNVQAAASKPRCDSEAPILTTLNDPSASDALRRSPSPKIRVNQPETEAAKKTSSRRHWTLNEEERFLRALQTFGPKDPTICHAVTGRVSVCLGFGVAELISIVVGTRSVAQVRSHAQKHYARIAREMSRSSEQGSAGKGSV